MDRPPVEDAPPPPAALKLANPLLKALLRSPLHRVAGKNVMLITVTGRKSGRRYTIPVLRHEVDGEMVLSAGGSWRHNLRGGADITLTIEGRDHHAHAVLEEDLDRAAEVFRKMVETDGSFAMAVKVRTDRPPTAADFKPLLAGRGVAYVTLSD
jgi:deazaflavin-dependent oxidoreductase (nitroreductase family)